MTEPISAAVTTFNGEDDLEDCLLSLFAQEGIEFDEVIVVDNASTDGTAAMVEQRFPDVRLVRLEKNEGPCPARNVALDESRNRLLFQVDHDVVVRPDCVMKLLAQMEGRDDVAIVSPRSLDAAHPDLVHYDGGSYHYAGVMALRHFFRPLADCCQEVEDVDAFISLAALMDREKVVQTGGYDKEFFILFEDHDLSYRIRLLGYRIVSVWDAIVDHRSGTEGISFRGGPVYPARRLFLHSRNRWMVVLKCYRLRTMLLAMPGILLLGMAYVFFAWTQGALLEYVRAKSSLIRLLPHIREKRRAIAGLRRLRDSDLLGAPDLTFSPRIERGQAGTLAERLLSGMLRLYWKLIRPFVG